MPPTGMLSAAEITAVEQWITDGALRKKKQEPRTRLLLLLVMTLWLASPTPHNAN